MHETVTGNKDIKQTAHNISVTLTQADNTTNEHAQVDLFLTEHRIQEDAVKKTKVGKL